MDSNDTWLYWYSGKERQIDPEVEKLASFFKTKDVSTVLDLGCGTGRHSVFLAKKGFKVSGFDQSFSAIKRAKKLAEQDRVALKLRRWDMTRFPFPYGDSTFSAVLSTKVIHHTTIENIQKIAQEVSRITRSGGYIFIEVPTISKLRRIKKEGKIHLKEIEKGTIVALDGDEPGITHHYFTNQELFSMFDAFHPIELRVRKEHYCLRAIKRRK